MKFGIDYFPDGHPDRVSGQQYFADVLDLAEYADDLGYDSVKIVEHYFTSYGGYSPDPCVFLAACSQRARRMRLVTGAVLPVFNHPLKLAGQLTMLDAISGGRLDAGIARAFLPYEFDAFGISMEESRARFEEGIEALIRLWTAENVTFEGKFHRFKNVTSLPRPTQKPHPPIWIAAVVSTESFVWTGQRGYNMMVVPYLYRLRDRQAERLGGLEVDDDLELRRYCGAFTLLQTTTPRVSGLPGRFGLSSHGVGG